VIPFFAAEEVGGGAAGCAVLDGRLYVFLVLLLELLDAFGCGDFDGVVGVLVARPVKGRITKKCEIGFMVLKGRYQYLLSDDTDHPRGLGCNRYYIRLGFCSGMGWPGIHEMTERRYPFAMDGAQPPVP